jgi:16S rRNA (cytidine1402-2'-O)-methyltransferase
MKATVYLIPSLLAEDSLDVFPVYITEAIKNCQVFFTENERTTRRYFKQLWKSFLPGHEIVIDDYEWINMQDAATATEIFKQKVKEGKTIGIVSDAGCPGVADPGQQFIAIAQQMNVPVKPLVGPNSILLALMASGMNGQQFQFHGYLPIEPKEREKAIKELETGSLKNLCTQIFIETPYRNNQVIEAMLKICNAAVRLCIAVDITGKNEWIRTMTIADWQKNKPDIHKRPAIFLLYAGN